MGQAGYCWLLIDMKAVRMFSDTKSLFFNAVGNGPRWTPQNRAVVFSIDEEGSELWVSTAVSSISSPWKEYIVSSWISTGAWYLPSVHVHFLPSTGSWKWRSLLSRHCWESVRCLINYEIYGISSEWKKSIYDLIVNTWTIGEYLALLARFIIVG